MNMLTPEEFPILPWGWTPGDEKALQEIKECGFNLAGFVSPENVDLVEKAGLKCIVTSLAISEAITRDDLTDDQITQRVGLAMNRFDGNSTVFGYYLRDEPTAHLYPNLARWAAEVYKINEQALAYINLFPMVANAEQLGVSSYEEYLERFVQEINPRFISYDHYAFFDDGSVADTFYQNLEAVRKVAERHNLPFWNIVLGNAHFHYASPTQGTLNLQVYATLAYGGRGISYFTYFAPLIGNYREAAVDQFMNKTPTWDMLRRINLQIHQLGPTYLKLKPVNVFHHPNIPIGLSGIDTSRYVAELNGGNFLVGEFEGPDGHPYIIVVNKDIHTSAPFAVRFKQPGQIMMTNSYTGKKEPWAGENNWLAPGQGMMLSCVE